MLIGQMIKMISIWLRVQDDGQHMASYHTNKQRSGYLALTYGICEAKWLRNILGEMGFDLSCQR